MTQMIIIKQNEFDFTLIFKSESFSLFFGRSLRKSHEVSILQNRTIL